MGALPRPASLEKIPRATPKRRAAQTVAPAKPPVAAEPVKALEHALGEAALYLLVAGLAVTPLRRLAGINLLKFRRAIGLACFFFVVLHLLTWAVLDVQRLDRVWADIVKRPYITVGMAAMMLVGFSCWRLYLHSARPRAGLPPHLPVG